MTTTYTARRRPLMRTSRRIRAVVHDGSKTSTRGGPVGAGNLACRLAPPTGIRGAPIPGTQGESKMNGNPVAATATAEEQPRKPRPPDGEQEPKYFLDIEGAEKPWYESTITTEQIIALGGWDPVAGSALDRRGQQRTGARAQGSGASEARDGLLEEDPVQARVSAMQERIDKELALLRQAYPDLEYQHEGRWVRVPAYPAAARLEPRDN